VFLHQNEKDSRKKSSFQFQNISMAKKNETELTAIKVEQWLNDWNNVVYGSKGRKKPNPFFYVFSVKADTLKKLSKFIIEKLMRKEKSS